MKKLILIPLLLSTLILTGCTCTTTYKTVVEIGGCNRDARCAVKFEDGTRGYAQYPIKGEIEEEISCK